MPKDRVLLLSEADGEAGPLSDSCAIVGGWGSAAVECFSGAKVSLAGAGAAADPDETCAEEAAAGTASMGATTSGAWGVATGDISAGS